MAPYGDGSDGHYDHQLRDDETLTAVRMAASLDGECAASLQAISRTLAEWPLVETVVRLGVTDDSQAPEDDGESPPEGLRT